MTASEVRMSPDGKTFALRRPGTDEWTLHGDLVWCGSGGNGAFVRDWTPLLPVSNEDRTIEPHLTMLRMVAERLESSAAISARPGQMEDLETSAGVIYATVTKLRLLWATSNKVGA